MYVDTSKGTSTYWFYDFPENRRSPVYDAIQENHPRKRLVQSFLYVLILYKTPIQTYRKEFPVTAAISEINWRRRMRTFFRCLGEFYNKIAQPNASPYRLESWLCGWTKKKGKVAFPFS